MTKFFTATDFLFYGNVLDCVDAIKKEVEEASIVVIYFNYVYSHNLLAKEIMRSEWVKKNMKKEKYLEGVLLTYIREGA